MNRKEYLLTLLIEELAEVQQAACKAQRFGLDDGYPGTDRTNEEDLKKEFMEALVAFELLFEPVERERKRYGIEMHEKKRRISDFMEYSIERGTLKPDSLS